MPSISRRKALRGLSVGLCGALTAGCVNPYGQSRNDWYVYAALDSADREEWEITEYSHEQVQANDFARELVPKAAETGSARKHASDAGKDAIDDLPTRYISYEQELVRMEMIHED
jgi:hypothetical protein